MGWRQAHAWQTRKHKVRLTRKKKATKGGVVSAQLRQGLWEKTPKAGSGRDTEQKGNLYGMR